jgi:transposase
MRKGLCSIELNKEDRGKLQKLIRARKTPQRVVMRARLVLMAGNGMTNSAIARELGVSRPTVISWLKRFRLMGIEGILRDKKRNGLKRVLTPEKIKEVVEATLNTKPRCATHWSCRIMAEAKGLSRMTVWRIWKAHNLKPHRVEYFKFSSDPKFVEKLRDVVGLYFNPPDKALVLSVDEKSQIQALQRTQPLLPLRPGLPARQTHDYKRNGITTLFSALNILDGKVMGKCYQRHRHQEFIKFLKEIDKTTPKELPLKLIVDNYGTHKHPKVKRWLLRHGRFHLHFTPTGASWVNMVERWLRELTVKRVRRGSFRNVSELVKAIYEYIEDNNKNPKPFVWKASVDSILNKINYCKELYGTLH